MTFGQTGCNVNQSTTDPAMNTTCYETCKMATVLKGDMMPTVATWTNPLTKIHSHNFCVPFSVRGIKHYMFFVVYMVNFNKVVMNMWNRTVWFYCTSVIADKDSSYLFHLFNKCWSILLETVFLSFIFILNTPNYCGVLLVAAYFHSLEHVLYTVEWSLCLVSSDILYTAGSEGRYCTG